MDDPLVKSEKLGTLAERLEFANALIKQHDRDRAKAEVELGKMTAYCHELEGKLNALTGLSKNQLKNLRLNVQYHDFVKSSEELKVDIARLRREHDRLIQEKVMLQVKS